MSAFKDVLDNDIKAVFLNADEHAELSHVIYDGVDREIPVILDRQMLQDRPVTKESGDHAKGIHLVTVTLYAAFSDFGFVPKQGKRITVNDEEFTIVTSTNEMRQVVCGLEAYGE
jgi:hypothetical protein